MVFFVFVNQYNQSKYLIESLSITLQGSDATAPGNISQLLFELRKIVLAQNK